CYKGVLDQYTNQVSLLDVIENIIAKPLEPLPSMIDAQAKDVRVPINLHLVTLWIRSSFAVPEECNTRVRLITPTGEDKRSGEQIMKVDLKNHLRSRSFVRIESLPFRGEGFYYFIVERNEAPDVWRTVAEVPLEFRLEASASADKQQSASQKAPALKD